MVIKKEFDLFEVPGTLTNLSEVVNWEARMTIDNSVENKVKFSKYEKYKN